MKNRLAYFVACAGARCRGRSSPRFTLPRRARRGAGQRRLRRDRRRPEGHRSRVAAARCRPAQVAACRASSVRHAGRPRPRRARAHEHRAGARAHRARGAQARRRQGAGARRLEEARRRGAGRRKKKKSKGKAKSKAKAEIEGGAEDRKGRKGKRKKAARGHPQPGRLAHAVQPRLRRRAAGSVDGVGCAELRDPQVPGAGVPAADLPGGGDPVRRALGGPGRDQRDRDRLRPQPERVLRRRAGLDAVHPLLLARVRGGREQGRQEGPLQPGRRDLRRRPLPQGRRLREGRAPVDLRLQPRRLVRRLGDAARPADLRRARPTSSARSPA